MKARGFTAMEMALVLSISAIVVSSGFTLWRSFDRQHRIAIFEAASAQGMRSLSEELRRDLRTLRWEGDRLSLSGPCGRVEYAAAEGTLLRRGDPACGPLRAVAAGVESIARVQSGVEVGFVSWLAPGDAVRLRFFLGGAP